MVISPGDHLCLQCGSVGLDFCWFVNWLPIEDGGNRLRMNFVNFEISAFVWVI